MSYTSTKTTTFTVSDIRKVVENFAADFAMMAQATGLRTPESVSATVHDLKVFAEYAFITAVTLILRDKDGNKLRAAVYNVNDSAAGWQSDRPGNNLWPRTPNGSLWIVADLTAAWWSKSEDDKTAFIQRHGLHSSWAPATVDTSVAGLTPTSGQRYASNGYGWQRTNYSG